MSKATVRTSGGIDATLTSEHIVDAAEEIIAARGVQGLNMRALATALGVSPPSVYRRLGSKQDVLSALAQRRFAQLELPAEGVLDWADELRAVFGALRKTALQNPELVEITTRQHINTPVTYQAAERILRALTRAGLDLEAAVSAFGTLSAFTFGFVEQELNADARERQMAERIVAVYALPEAEYPLVRASATSLLNRNSERHFELGLDLLLQGIAATGGIE